MEYVERLQAKNGLQKVNYFYQKLALEDYTKSLGDKNPLTSDKPENSFKLDKSSCI